MAFLLINFLFTLLISVIDAGNVGITMDLIHRDSPLSPYYNPNETRFERRRNAFRRSFARKASLYGTSTSAKDSNSLIQAPILVAHGEYLMKFSIGSPPVEILAIADTGSNLLWTQCLPCAECFPQNAPPFDPSKSSSYKGLSCESQQCTVLRGSSCDNANNCNYFCSYGDKSYTKGDLATEKLTLQSGSGESVSFPSVTFGCGHENDGMFRDPATGIIGLGASEDVSIVNQLSESIGGKFSYCFQSEESSAPSKISFGSNAMVSGPNVVSTPLISTSPYYYLNLEGVSVGSNRLDYKTLNNFTTDSSHDTEFDQNQGNIIIDSGTTLTFLPQQFYQQVELALAQVIKEQRVDDPQGRFNLCYQVNGEYIDVPTIIFHFTNADVLLPSASTFLEVTNGVFCSALAPAQDSAIFGYLSQKNYLVGYDLVNNKVSFMPTDCSKST